MVNPSEAIPTGAVFFAHQIVERFHLDRASSIDFIQKAIAAALRDQEDMNRSRELVGCTRCGMILSRYACVQERFGTCCPQCRTPMTAREVLHQRRIAELEERLKQLDGGTP
ncbi:MAG TPA: hypothetical protein VKW04_11565 [Planctomycetota bacterium]|nr:hypothetical protein [Planctomycetota bacterium]